MSFKSTQQLIDPSEDDDQENLQVLSQEFKQQKAIDTSRQQDQESHIRSVVDQFLEDQENNSDVYMTSGSSRFSSEHPEDNSQEQSDNEQEDKNNKFQSQKNILNHNKIQTLEHPHTSTNLKSSDRILDKNTINNDDGSSSLKANQHEKYPSEIEQQQNINSSRLNPYNKQNFLHNAATLTAEGHNHVRVQSMLPDIKQRNTMKMTDEAESRPYSQARNIQSVRSTRSRRDPDGQKEHKKHKLKVTQLTKLEILIRILQKGFRQRSDRDLENLVPLIKAIQFFQERDIKDHDYREIVSCLTYEHFNSGDTVFQYGEIGDKFYIILQGSVRVLIPDYQNKEVHKEIDHVRAEVNSIKKELKEVQAALDQEKKIAEEYFKKLKEEEEIFSNEQSDRASVNSRALSERKITRKISQKKNEIIQQNQIDSQMRYASNPQKQMTLGNVGLIKLQEINGNRDKQHSLATPGHNAHQTNTNLSKFAPPMPKASAFLDSFNVFEEEREELSRMEKERKKKQPNPVKKTLQSSDLTLEERKQLLIEQIQELKKKEEETLFIEVVQLNTGKSFGELALIKNKPRAATIKCSDECHLGVMSKADYDKVLLRIEQKNLNKLLEFLHYLPFLQTWSKIQLQKLQYAFELKNLKRNSVLYKEGEPCSHVYIIKNGDFEVAKRVRTNDGTESMIENMHNMLGPQSPTVAIDKNGKTTINNNRTSHGPNEISSFKDFMHSRKISEANRLKQGDKAFESLNEQQQLNLTLSTKKKKVIIPDEKLQLLAKNKIMAPSGGQLTYNTYKIAQIGTGQLLGEEDNIAQRNYSTTVTCKSNVGEVFCIKANEFIKRLKANSDSWKIIILMSMGKEKAIFERIKKIKKLLKNNQTVTDPEYGGFGFSLLKDNILLNQNEIDVREKFKEIINDYPSVVTQKKIIEKSLKKIRVNQASGLEEDYPLNNNRSAFKEIGRKRTIEINLRSLSAQRKKRKSSNLPSIALERKIENFKSASRQDMITQNNKNNNNSRSQSPLAKMNNIPPKQNYISSKIADLLAASFEGKSVSEEMKNMIQAQRFKQSQIGFDKNQNQSSLLRNHQAAVGIPQSQLKTILMNEHSNSSLDNFNPLIKNISKQQVLQQDQNNKKANSNNNSPKNKNQLGHTQAVLLNNPSKESISQSRNKNQGNGENNIKYTMSQSTQSLGKEINSKFYITDNQSINQSYQQNQNEAQAAYPGINQHQFDNSQRKPGNLKLNSSYNLGNISNQNIITNQNRQFNIAKFKANPNLHLTSPISTDYPNNFINKSQRNSNQQSPSSFHQPQYQTQNNTHSVRYSNISIEKQLMRQQPNYSYVPVAQTLTNSHSKQIKINKRVSNRLNSKTQKSNIMSAASRITKIGLLNQSIDSQTFANAINFKDQSHKQIPQMNHTSNLLSKFSQSQQPTSKNQNKYGVQMGVFQNNFSKPQFLNVSQPLTSTHQQYNQQLLLQQQLAKNSVLNNKISNVSRLSRLQDTSVQNGDNQKDMSMQIDYRTPEGQDRIRIKKQRDSKMNSHNNSTAKV